jgi:serine protease Do
MQERKTMKNFIRSAGRVALAAVTAAAVTVAVTSAARPVSAQEPRVVLRSIGAGASIGVSIRNVTSDDAAKAKMGQPGGVYVESVREGSPAAKAGIQNGDIVVEFDGERVRSASHFTRLVQESAPNRQMSAVVIRGTSRQTLSVVPEESGSVNVLSDETRRRLQDLERRLPRELENFNFDAGAVRRGVPVNSATLGVTLAPLSDQLASYFGVKQGVLVSSVAADSPAATAGIKAGDVITAVNGQNVSRSADITRALRDKREETVDVAVTRDRKSLSLKATIPVRNRPSGRGLPV